MKSSLRSLALLSLLSTSLVLAAAPKGKNTRAKMTAEEKAALEGLQGKVNGKIVWSSSRASRYHDIWIMNADGTDMKALTKSNNVDWFSRFSPDGKRVLFSRSKRKWASESTASRNERWDLFVIGTDGEGEKKVVENATWGNWRPDGKTVVFARRTKVYSKNIESGEETLLLDCDEHLGGATAQQPQMSPDGNYIAATLRGRKRELGVWDLKNKKWTKTFGASGCQINWFPSGDKLFWVNQSTGKGGTEVFTGAFKDGGLASPDASYDDMKWVDLPGRRSHEYFPKISPDGQWLVWCATARGHDHDIYDYEVHLNKVDAPVAEAVRLTFYSCNDRWPDVYVEGAAGGK